MLAAIASELGKFAARFFEKPQSLSDLNLILKNMFAEIERISEGKLKFDFSSELKDELVTESKCPIHSFYPLWCEEACIPFIESFVKALNDRIEVERIEKQPGKCRFRFRLKEV